MIELSISMLITGAIVFTSACVRSIRLRQLSVIAGRLERSLDVSGLDLTGRSEYVGCFSHEWAIDNMTRRKHTSIGLRFQESLRDNTLITFMAMALVLGSAAVLFGLLVVGAVTVFGGAVLFFLAGAAVLMGPGDPRLSEVYLSTMNRVRFSKLNREDYVYVRLAINSVRKWIQVSGAIGLAFMIFSPWAMLMPEVLGTVISLLVVHLVIGPAMSIARFSVALAILYIPVMLVLVCVVIPEALRRFIKRHDEEGPTDATTAQW